MSDLFDVRAGTCHFTSSALAISGAATTYSTTGTQTYTNLGQIYTVAAKSSVATPTLDANTGVAFTPLQNGKQCMFVFCWDTSGTLQVAQGPIVNTADVVAGASALHLPRIPDNLTPFAAVSIAHANATAWQFGVSNWNATGVTLGTVRNYGWLPSKPFTAST